MLDGLRLLLPNDDDEDEEEEQPVFLSILSSSKPKSQASVQQMPIWGQLNPIQSAKGKGQGEKINGQKRTFLIVFFFFESNHILLTYRDDE